MFFFLAVIVFASCNKEKTYITPPVITNREYDLDITFNNTFSFTENYNNPWADDFYYDLTIIEGKGIFLPLDEFNIYVSEYADTALSNIIYGAYFAIKQDKFPYLYIDGICSINFKKLIRQGGGSFNGAFTVTSGSAKAYTTNVLNNPPPLTVTGSLDLIRYKATLRIKGKVYF